MKERKQVKKIPSYPYLSMETHRHIKNLNSIVFHTKNKRAVGIFCLPIVDLRIARTNLKFVGFQKKDNGRCILYYKHKGIFE